MTISFHEPTSRAPGSRRLVERADLAFARLSPYRGEGLRNHCLRLHEYTRLLLGARPEPIVDAELYLVAMVHDLGLVAEGIEGASYPERSRALFAELTRDVTLRSPRRALDECLLYNHRLVPPFPLSPLAEAFRRAVQIDHSRGLVRHGLERGALREIQARHPWGDFDSVLVDFARRVLRHEPWTLVRGIFL